LLDVHELGKLRERLSAITKEPTVSVADDVPAVAIDRALDPGASQRDDSKIIASWGAVV
jgi:hypothetical protein